MGSGMEKAVQERYGVWYGAGVDEAGLLRYMGSDTGI